MSKIKRTISRSEHDFDYIEVEDNSMDKCLEVYKKLRTETYARVNSKLQKGC